MKLKALDIEWDSGNYAKCTKHGVSTIEIEDMFKLDDVFIVADKKHSTTEERLIAVGKPPQGRFVFVAFTIRNNAIRPVSARYMHKGEIERYEKEDT